MSDLKSPPSCNLTIRKSVQSYWIHHLMYSQGLLQAFREHLGTFCIISRIQVNCLLRQPSQHYATNPKPVSSRQQTAAPNMVPVFLISIPLISPAAAGTMWKSRGNGRGPICRDLSQLVRINIVNWSGGPIIMAACLPRRSGSTFVFVTMKSKSPQLSFRYRRRDVNT